MSDLPKIPRYQALARAIAWRERVDSGDGFVAQWTPEHTAEVRAMVDARLNELMSDAPSGSGIDSGTELDSDSTPKRLIFTFGYHHMDDVGCYDGWTDHSAIVTPNLQWGFNLRITGRDRNQVKDCLYDVFNNWLSDLVDQHVKQ
jgi:hypothetical protein